MGYRINNPVTIILGTGSADKMKYFKSVANSNLRYDKILQVGANSGVSAQPIGLAEIKTGADNRAREAFLSNNSPNKIGVGMEGGLVKNGSEYYLKCFVIIYGGNYYRGNSEKIALPVAVSKTIQSGGEFGVEIRKYKPWPEERCIVEELVSRERFFKEAIQEAVVKCSSKQ